MEVLEFRQKHRIHTLGLNQVAIPGGRPAFPAYGGGAGPRQLPPAAFGGFGAQPGIQPQVKNTS